MMGDYKTAQLLFEDRLREAEQHRLQRELRRAADEYNRAQGRGLLRRIKLWMRIEPQVLGAKDARHAHAL